MHFPLAMMYDNIWIDRLSYIEAEEHHRKKATNAMDSSPVANEKSQSNMVTGETDMASLITKFEEENKAMRKFIVDLAEEVSVLSSRVEKLEGKSPESSSPEPGATKKKAGENDDDDFDIFDDEDDEEEEETEEEKKKKEELLRKYHEKKSQKPVLVAKSNIVLDVKPWDDETDLAEMERLVRTIEMDGLLWGNSKLVPVGYGIRKLQISCVVEDEKVGSEILDEEITKFEDYVQSVDIAAFNKI